MATFQRESMYNLCRKKGIKLLRYDFNEPCCGKDQCDRESAAAKTILRSYVDAGNDLLTAEHLHESLHYGFGMKDSKVQAWPFKARDHARAPPHAPRPS